jgi:hypothetical protein
MGVTRTRNRKYLRTTIPDRNANIDLVFCAAGMPTTLFIDNDAGAVIHAMAVTTKASKSNLKSAFPSCSGTAGIIDIDVLQQYYMNANPPYVRSSIYYPPPGVGLQDKSMTSLRQNSEDMMIGGNYLTGFHLSVYEPNVAQIAGEVDHLIAYVMSSVLDTDSELLRRCGGIWFLDESVKPTRPIIPYNHPFLRLLFSGGLVPIQNIASTLAGLCSSIASPVRIAFMGCGEIEPGGDDWRGTAAKGFEKSAILYRNSEDLLGLLMQRCTTAIARPRIQPCDRGGAAAAAGAGGAGAPLAAPGTGAPTAGGRRRMNRTKSKGKPKNRKQTRKAQ